MTQECEWEQSQGSGSGFFTGLVAGALIGTGLGLLFAPRRGVEFRGQVAESAATVGQAISKTVDEWTERGREVYDRARDVAARAGGEIDRVVADTAKTVESAMNGAANIASVASRRLDKHVVSRA